MRKPLLLPVAMLVMLGVDAGGVQEGAATAARTRTLIDNSGVGIDVVAEGRGPLVVLLPSLGRDSFEFDPLAEPIAAAGFRVLRPQPRGFGKSVGPMEGLTLHDFARDVAAVIEHERAGPAVVAGHAFGHFVAKMTAVDFPRLVRGVVLVAATQKNMDPEVRRWNAIGSDPTRPEAERLKYLQMVFFAPGHDPRVWLTGFDPAVRRSQDAARVATPLQEYWAAGTAPLLDLQADRDPYRPRSTADELVQEFGRERVSVALVQDASHALPIEQPRATAEAIIAFARRLSAPAAQAAELRVLCSNGIRGAVEQLRPEAERAIGRRLSIRFSSSTALQQAIEQGEAFDLAILTPDIVADLVARNRIRAGSPTTLASADIAVGIRAGGPKADVSTSEAIRRRLLAARSLTWTTGGASAAPVAAMLEALGIAEQLKPRIVLQQVPGTAAETVARGENELVLAPVSEIQTIRGVEVLGVLPKEFQRPVVMTAGIAAQTPNAAAALALVRFLTSAAAAPAIQATGMMPARRP